MKFAEKIHRLCRELGDQTAIDALLEDEHLRMALYRRAFSVDSGCEEEMVLAVLACDPDLAMSEAVLVEHVDAVAGDRGWRELAHRAASCGPTFESYPFARLRLNEWMILGQLLDGESVPSVAYLGGSDWLQRKIVEEVARYDILSELADGGRTKRVRATAALRLTQ